MHVLQAIQWSFFQQDVSHAIVGCAGINVRHRDFPLKPDGRRSLSMIVKDRHEICEIFSALAHIPVQLNLPRYTKCSG
jgi:hypothetical protein